MQKLRGSHAVSGLFVFLLVGLFAVSALMLTLMGVRVYRHVADAGAQSLQTQTLMSYLCNKLHAYDEVGGVTVDEQDGRNVLSLWERLEDGTYRTAIYAHEGAVYEQLLLDGDELDPELGQPISQVQSLAFALADGQVTLSAVEPDGVSRVLRVALRSAPEGGD